ncbi:MAG: N-acyl homoserine lactonase family protein [Alphaproteobacteria bacterium]|nr:N-acyl homoserine lactonase family protein [Alphaproteobacteria bacterium]
MKKIIRIAAVSLGAIGLAACSPGEKAQEAPAPAEDATETASAPEASSEALRLYTFDCGRIDMLDLGLFSSNGEYAGRQNKAADMCFLIRHPKGDLMWDAGLPDSFHEQEGGVTNGPFRVAVPTTLASQLASIDVAPADIEYFSISHSHFDHVGNAAMFVGATFLVDKDERAYMFRDEARADEQTFPLVALLEDAPTTEFDGDYDVFGDGSVTILAMPGHTPGHTSLLVNLENTGPVLLTGDLYHLLESREKHIVPTFNTDEEETLRSMDKFEALAAETGARVVVQHALEDMEKMPKAPEYLD